MSDIHSSKYTFIIYYSKDIEGSRQGAKDLEQAFIFATNNASRVFTYDVTEKNHLKSLMGRDKTSTRIYMVGVAPTDLVSSLRSYSVRNLFFVGGDTALTTISSSLKGMMIYIPAHTKSLRDNAASVARSVRSESMYAPGDRVFRSLMDHHMSMEDAEEVDG